MPIITRRIRSRGYELDANATVPPSTLLRYLEYMRWESAADPVVGLGTLFEDGFRMVVRAQQLEVEADIGLEVDLEVSIELARAGRASLDMTHEVTRVEDGKRVARAIVTAVYLDANGRPHPIPNHVRELTSLEKRPELVSPLVEVRPADAWSRPLTVVPSDLDLFQHVNHARYLDYFNDTRLMAAAAGGYGDVSKAAARPLARASLDYRHSAIQGDQLVVSTWPLSDTGEALGIELHHENGDVLCGGRLEVRQ